jgi:methylphosphotriester-DNA--protein-cysteine methyltransferase
LKNNDVVKKIQKAIEQRQSEMKQEKADGSSAAAYKESVRRLFALQTEIHMLELALAYFINKNK